MVFSSPGATWQSPRIHMQDLSSKLQAEVQLEGAHEGPQRAKSSRLRMRNLPRQVSAGKSISMEMNGFATLLFLLLRSSTSKRNTVRPLYQPLMDAFCNTGMHGWKIATLWKVHCFSENSAVFHRFDRNHADFVSARVFEICGERFCQACR